LNLSSSPEAFSEEIDFSSYSRWQDIFRSWFWRYYDHLFQLILYNFGWFSTCLGVGWLASSLGILSRNQQWNWFVIYPAFVLECAISVPWALVIFKIFIEDNITFSELLADLRLCFWKALASIAISGLVLGLALYNISFYYRLQVSSRIWVFILIGLVATVFLYGLMMTFYQWPILFFQKPPFGKLLYRSFLITLGTGPSSLLLLFFSLLAVFFFVLVPFLWALIGFVFLFSLYVVALEKHFLRYKITYGEKPAGDFIKLMDLERQRGWRDIFKPWETR
jgi:hypothetical protein